MLRIFLGCLFHNASFLCINFYGRVCQSNWKLKHAYSTAIADGEGNLSSHYSWNKLESLCLQSYEPKKFQWKKKEAKMLPVLTCLLPFETLFPIGLYGRKCHWDSLASITASSSLLLLLGTFISAVCVSFSFCRWKLVKKFTCRAWWPRTRPVLLHICFTFYFIRTRTFEAVIQPP